MSRARFLCLAVAVVCLSAAFTSLWAATTEVGNCSPAYPQYATIQGAITASPNNSTILVCPGTYPEQVVINKALTLKGFNNASIAGSGARIVPPSGGLVANGSNLYGGDPIAAQILVASTTGPVSIIDLTVDGANNGLSGCSPDFVGIVYQNTSGTIQHVGVLNQILSGDLLGCQTGLGIYIQSLAPGTSAVTVTQSVVQNYQKNGITANEAGTTATITSNNVTGIGATPAIAQNGIQIAYGAAGTISSNDVSDDVYTGGFYGSAGILVYASPNVSITSNTISNTQYGVTVDSDPDLGAADNAIVNANRISSTRNFDAIDLCSDHDTAKNNTLSASDEAGIHIDSLCQSPGGNPTGNNDLVTNNSINVACTGILLGLGTGNTTTPNNYFNVPTLTLGGDNCTPPPGSGKPSRSGKRTVKPARL